MSSETRPGEVRVPMTHAIAAPSAWLRNVGIVMLGTAFLAACAHVSVPLYFTPVPLTLQPFGVLLLGLLLSPRLAGTTLFAYLGEGAIGFPVFSPGPAGASGLLHLVGPTGGYLLAYPFAALLIAFLFRRMQRSYASALLAAAAGDLLILTVGALWLAVLTHAPLQVVLSQTLVPFFPGDALKIIAAASIATGWFRLRHRTSGSTT